MDRQNDDSTTVAVAPAEQAGCLQHPRGEETAGHDRASGGSKPGDVLADLPPEGESPTQSAGATGAVEGRKIVRATMRFAVAVKAMSDDERKRFYAEADRSLQDALWVYNAVARDLWRRDGEALDALRIAHPQGDERFWAPPKGTWKFNIDGKESYALGRKVAPELASTIVSSIAYEVRAKWCQVRWRTLRKQDCRPLGYTCPPIPLRKRELDVTETGISYSLRAGKNKRIHIPLVVKDYRQRVTLQNLARKVWLHGAGELERDKDRPGKWYVRISYSRLVTETPPDERTAAINRGIRFFLTCVTHSGETTLVKGHDIVAHLKGIQARRAKYGRAYRTSGRKGRGTKRAVKRLAQNAANWRRTRNQTIARELIRWLQSRSITVLYIEDFTGVRSTAVDDLGEHIGQLVQEWPYYDLETRITSCAEEAGMHVVRVAPEHISQACPQCGHVDEANRDLKRWVLDCQKCSYKRHLDITAATNVLKRGEKFGGEVKVGDKALGKTGGDPDKKRTARKPRPKGAKSRGTRRSRGKK